MGVFIRLRNVTIVGEFTTYILYCYMFRSYDHHQEENILIAMVTQYIYFIYLTYVSNVA
jgi:hypothetical protein